MPRIKAEAPEIRLSPFDTKAAEYALVALCGGTAYCAAELLRRGSAHIRTAICGALCLCLIYSFEKNIRFRRVPLPFRAIAGGITIPAVELAARLIADNIYGLYGQTAERFDMQRQISPGMLLMRILLCLPIFPLCGLIRHGIFRRF